jgi:hypothetical protein
MDKIARHYADEIIARMGSLKTTMNKCVERIENSIESFEKNEGKIAIIANYGDQLKKAYAENGKLSNSLVRYMWRNYPNMDSKLVDWAIPQSKLSDLSIEKLLIQSWNFSNLVVGKKYAWLKGKIKSPSFFSTWEILDNEIHLLQAAPEIINNHLNGPRQFSRQLQRTSLFELFAASHCFKSIDPKDLVEYLDKLRSEGLGRLHLDSIIKLDKFDTATNLVIASLFKNFKNGIARPDNHYTYLSYIKKILGDPRSVGHKWEPIERLEKQGFQNWVSSLNEEDIVFFFDNMERVIHPERKAFWLQFKRTASKIIVVLDKVQRDRLLKHYSENAKLKSIVERSFQFKYENKSEQQLIIYFINSYVFVEGSNTGFACQVYEESEFKKRFEKSFYLTIGPNTEFRIKENYSNFRGAGSGRLDALIHNPPSPGWERKFLVQLSDLGVFPDQTQNAKSRL